MIMLKMIYHLFKTKLAAKNDGTLTWSEFRPSFPANQHCGNLRILSLYENPAPPYPAESLAAHQR